MSAQEFIIILVTAAFMRCLRMAVEHRDTEIIKTVLVGKFAAVVAGNGQKQFIEVSAEFLLQSLHGFGSAGRGLIGHFQHNFLSGHSFRNDKAGFFFAFTTTDYTVNFPVTEGIPEVYIFRTLFNTAVQGVSCTDRLFVCLYGIFSLFGMSDRQMTDLEKMIGNEVKELKTLYDMSEAEYDRRSEEGENIDLIDYVSDVLDTEYILDSNFTLIGARLYITLGGPTIYVDTHDNEVVGHWGTEQVTRWLPSESQMKSTIC